MLSLFGKSCVDITGYLVVGTYKQYCLKIIQDYKTIGLLKAIKKKKNEDLNKEDWR